MNSLTRMVGLFLLLIGLGAAVFFLMFFDVSVETAGGIRVVNLGKIADRHNGIIFGVGVAIVGAVVLAIGSMGAKPPEPSTAAAPKTDPKATRPGGGPTWKTAGEIESEIDWDKI